MQYKSLFNHTNFCFQLKRNISLAPKFYSTGLFHRAPVNITHKRGSGVYKYSDLPASFPSLYSQGSIRLYTMSHTPRVLTGKKKKKLCNLNQTAYDGLYILVGTGAVGAIYTWRLSKSCNVTTVCRSNYDIVNEKGFEMDSAKFGVENFKPDNGKHANLLFHIK